MDKVYYFTNSLVPCEPVANTAPTLGDMLGVRSKCAPQKKEDTKMSRYDEKNIYVENDLNIEATKSDASKAREYLYDRVFQVSLNKKLELERKFGLLEDEHPKTASEFLARILSGKYVLSDKKKDKIDYDPARFIEWYDPAVKPDQAGFNSAWEAFEVQYQASQDIIAVKSPDDGLVALQALEAWTPTKT